MKLSKQHKADLILLFAVILFALAAFVLTLCAGQTGKTLVVYRGGDEIARYPLDADISFRLDAPDGGYNLVCIENGGVDMKEASCPDKICVHHRKISKSGQTIICLPNKIILKIVGGEDAPLDLS